MNNTTPNPIQIIRGCSLVPSLLYSLFYVSKAKLSVNLGNIYFNSCSDKHHIPHLLVKASKQSAAYCEHLSQAHTGARECMFRCEWAAKVAE